MNSEEREIVRETLVIVDAIARNAIREVDQLINQATQGVLVLYTPGRLRTVRDMLDHIEHREQPLMNLINEQGRRERNERKK